MPGENTHVSLSELELALLKGVQAVGLSAGLGEEAGAAARFALVCGWDPTPAYAGALEALGMGASASFNAHQAIQGTFQSQERGCRLSALATAPSLSDLLGTDDQQAFILSDLDSPAVLLAQLCLVSRQRPGSYHLVLEETGEDPNEKATEIVVQDGRCTATTDRLRKLVRQCDLSLRCHWAPPDDNPPPTPLPDAGAARQEGADIDGEVWETIYRFYIASFVESSEASRLKGAGAGLTDND